MYAFVLNIIVASGPRDEGGTHWARAGGGRGVSGGRGQARRTLPMEVERCPINVVRVEGHARARASASLTLPMSVAIYSFVSSPLLISSSIYRYDS